jgi:HAD superfamily hydrolase (TIGR01509 family)
MMIRALIFDFDGLILDSETAVYQSWQEIYQEHRQVLPLEKWLLRIGGSIEQFDAHTYLETLIARSLSRQELDIKRRARQWELLADTKAFPGIKTLLASAKQRKMKVGLASSSEQLWVAGHLNRLGLLSFFDCIQCGDDVAHLKPHPELYLAVLEKLGIRAEQAIALEDSPNGVLSAQQAGIFCVAVPNAITRTLSFNHADMQLASLDRISLDELLTIVEAQRT